MLHLGRKASRHVSLHDQVVHIIENLLKIADRRSLGDALPPEASVNIFPQSATSARSGFFDGPIFTTSELLESPHVVLLAS